MLESFAWNKDPIGFRETNGIFNGEVINQIPFSDKTTPFGSSLSFSLASFLHEFSPNIPTANDFYASTNKDKKLSTIQTHINEINEFMKSMKIISIYNMQQLYFQQYISKSQIPRVKSFFNGNGQMYRAKMVKTPSTQQASERLLLRKKARKIIKR